MLFSRENRTPEQKLIARMASMKGLETFALVKAWRQLARPSERVRTVRWEGGTGGDPAVIGRALGEIGFMNAAVVFEGFDVPTCVQGRPMIPVLDIDLARSRQADGPFPKTGRLQIWIGEDFFARGADVKRCPGNGYFEVVYIPDARKRAAIGLHGDATRTLYKVDRLEKFRHHIQPGQLHAFVEFVPDLAPAIAATWREMGTTTIGGNQVFTDVVSDALSDHCDPDEVLDWNTTPEGGVVLGGWPRCEQDPTDEYGGLDVLLSITLYELEGDSGCCYVNFCGRHADMRAGDFSKMGYDIQA